MLGPSEMKGKTALVTGASGDLGKAVALKLAAAGADICLVDPDAAAMEAAAGEVRALGVRAHVYASDLRGAASCRGAVDAAVGAFGRLDALCNVANVFAPAHAEDMAEADWEATMAVNIGAVFYLFQAAVPHLLEANGAVVSVGSCGAFMASPFTAAYTASKAALVQMTKVLAKEFIDKPIRINCLAPGSMSVSSGIAAKIPANVDMSKVQKLSRALITVEDVAAITAFLVSPAAVGFHGSCLTMDNGLSLG
jgi:NAD(P)-dependent dehydrogenase (short-subunit alcohol dehydrogenase family)